MHGFRTSLCVFHVGALPDGGRRVVLFRTLASYDFRRKGQSQLTKTGAGHGESFEYAGWNSSRQTAVNVSMVALSGMIVPQT